jgi:adenylylsulfate kinase-like enzyme
VSVCESRDPKGLYKKARSGEITNFTGVSAPYEVPASPALTLNTGDMSVSESVDSIWALLADKGVFLGT